MKYTLELLAVDHDYYASESNYYSNEARARFTTFADFYEEYASLDIDMNLIYRWDIQKREKSERYCLEIFMIQQRKGIYLPIMIDYIDEADVPKFVELVKKHWEKLVALWTPISALPSVDQLNNLFPNPRTGN